jgi:hypothetical protein
MEDHFIIYLIQRYGFVRTVQLLARSEQPWKLQK